MISYKYSAVGSRIMLSGNKTSRHYFFVLLSLTIIIIAAEVTISNLYAGSYTRNGNVTGIPVPVAAAIAGGTGKYQGVSGTATITERFYEPGRALFLDVILDIIHSTSLR